MADLKISDLTTISDVATGDLLAVVDITEDVSNGGASRKVTTGNLVAGGAKGTLTTANSMLITDESNNVAKITLAERDTVYRAASGTVVANNGRNFLDTVMRGPIGISTALSYQPHYFEYWHDGVASASWPSGAAGTAVGAVHVYYEGDAGAATLRIPEPTSANEGDTIHIYNRGKLATADYLLVLETGAGSLAPDEDDSGGGAKTGAGAWRLYYGDFLVFHCKQNISTTGYAWYQIGGTPLENRKELFITATGLDFTSTTQYCPGEVTVRVTATGQTFTLPEANDNRRYRFRFYMATGSTDTTTINVTGSNTITDAEADAGNTSITLGGTSATAMVELWSQSGGIWYAVEDNDAAYT